MSIPQVSPRLVPQAEEPKPPAPKRLAAKLAEVMAECHRIPKRGRNEFHKYDYATESDIVEVVRVELAKRAVVLVPAVTKQTREAVGEKGSVLTTLDMTFTFMDGESGEQIVMPWIGAGSDKEDKGAYKAMTGATKYFLMKVFLLPTGDDPEQDEQRNRQSARVKPRRDEAPPDVDPRTGEIIEPPQSAKPGGALVISEAQRKRLYAISKQAGWKDDEVKTLLLSVFGFESSQDITRDKYDAICKRVELGN